MVTTAFHPAWSVTVSCNYFVIFLGRHYELVHCYHLLWHVITYQTGLFLAKGSDEMIFGIDLHFKLMTSKTGGRVLLLKLFVWWLVVG